MYSRIFDYRWHQESTFPNGIGPTAGSTGPTGGSTGGVPGLTGSVTTPLPPCPCVGTSCISYSGAPYTIEGQSTSIECCCDETTYSTSSVTVSGEIVWYKNGIRVYRENFTDNGYLDSTIVLNIGYTYWDDSGETQTDSGSFYSSIDVGCPVVSISPPAAYFPTILDDVTSCNYAISCDQFVLRWNSQDIGIDTYTYTHRITITVSHDSSRCCN